MGLTSDKLYSGSPDIWSDRTYYRKKSFNARSKKCQGTVSKQMICLFNMHQYFYTEYCTTIFSPSPYQCAKASHTLCRWQAPIVRMVDTKCLSGLFVY